jgi:hypothetical protein
VSTSTATATATSTGGDTTTDTTDGPIDTGSGFIQAPDGQGFFCLGCDVWAQDCPRGEKCSPWNCDEEGEQWKSSRCTPLAEDPAEIGEPCVVQEGPFSGLDDCGVAALCWNVDADTLQGECVAFCTGSEANPGCEDPARSCYIGVDGVPIACLTACDPLAPACEADENCVHNSDGYTDQLFVCMPDELISGHAYGEDCSETMLCDEGLLCRAAQHVPSCGTDSCCTLFGSFADPPDCPEPGQTCQPLFPGAPPGLDDYCYCGVRE